MNRLLILLIIALAAVGFVPRVCAAAEKFEGRVHDDSTNAGIAALTVRLRPPKGSKEAEKLETTDAEGKFRFKDLQGDRYLLEVSQGPRVLYRKEVKIPTDTKLEIPLRRSKK
jgi:hypothetical protein